MSVRVRVPSNNQAFLTGRPPHQMGLGRLGTCSRCMRASAGLAGLMWLAWVILAMPRLQLVLRPAAFAVASLATLLFIAHVCRYLLLRRQRAAAATSLALSSDGAFAAVMSLLSERH